MKEFKDLVTLFSFKKANYFFFPQEIWEDCWLDFTVGKLQCGFLVRAQGAESGECPFNTHSL